MPLIMEKLRRRGRGACGVGVKGGTVQQAGEARKPDFAVAHSARKSLTWVNGTETIRNCLAC
jgi:hypothetical protein